MEKRRRAAEGERQSKIGVNDKGGLDNNCERILKNKKQRSTVNIKRIFLPGSLGLRR
jgi:hypothetical protein